MIRSRFISVALVVGCCLLTQTAHLHAADGFRFEEAQSGKGELKYINGVPVLFLEGTPEEIGTQAGKLTGKAIQRMLTYPKEFLKKHDRESALPLLLAIGKSMEPQFPRDHLKELETAAKIAGVDRDLSVAGQAFADIKKFGGCSTLIVEADHSSTKGPIFGRNLDYPTLGFLHEYSLVTVSRPKGKHAFASVGFPGFVGCLSGMNDAGLSLAILEVYASKDESPRFDPKGTPYALCYRRVLEECTTIEEAEKLLRSMHRTTYNNLAICDRKGGAVFEITPQTVCVRRSEEGACLCTNHFRTKDLAVNTVCRRYSALEKCKDMKQVDVAEVMKLLDSANQGDRTFQTMIFEPKALKMHVSIGKLPSSAQEPKLLELEKYFKKK